MTQELFLRLKEYETHLFTAYRCNYVRMLDRNTASNLADIYEKLYHQQSRILNGCGHCVLNNLKRMGQDYFKYKENLELNEQVVKEPEPIHLTKRKSTDKPKRNNNKVTNKDNK